MENDRIELERIEKAISRIEAGITANAKSAKSPSP